MQTIKKYWAYFLLLIAIVFFIFKNAAKQNEVIQIKTFAINNGWGYDIHINNKIYIHQEIIPAIEGRKSFVNKEDAEKVGQLVVNKIKAKKGGGLPQITIKELDSLNIIK
ncbi:MAG: DUF4907 domain-containing protein [Chitinophagaceae bacterium]